MTATFIAEGKGQGRAIAESQRPTQAMAVRRRLRATAGLALVLVLAPGTTAHAVGQHPGQATPVADTMRRESLAGSDRTTAGVIIGWNAVAHDIAVAEDQFLTFKGQRALAMMHLAMHDALNSIVPVYQRFAYAGPQLAAHPVAAAAQGAHDVLVSQYPDQRSRLTTELSHWLDEVPSGTLREQGIELGRAAAAAILNVRANDRFDFPGTYEFRDGAGQYQTTPPWNGFVATARLSSGKALHARFSWSVPASAPAASEEPGLRKGV